MRGALAAAFVLIAASARGQAPPEPLPPWPDPPPPAPPAPAPSTDGADEEEAVPLALPPPELPEELPDPWRLILSANGRLDLGMLPALAVGMGGGIGMRYGRMRLDLEASFWLPQEEVIEGTSAGGDFRLFTGGLSGCPLILRAPVELGPCVGLELGRMSVESFGTVNAGETALLWAAFLGDVQLTWVISLPVALRAEVGAVVPFRRPRWIVQEGLLDRPGLAGVRGQLGIEVHL